jgi:hypothetical protein
MFSKHDRNKKKLSYQTSRRTCKTFPPNIVYSSHDVFRKILQTDNISESDKQGKACIALRIYSSLYESITLALMSLFVLESSYEQEQQMSAMNGRGRYAESVLQRLALPKILIV